MSKKKATMTLKDFHGGSIPSDLRLPSAPGVMARPADRGSLDQQSLWGNSMGRSNHRLRPASAGSARNFDDKTPFLSHSAHIGRNFDEDERKPLDGLPGPRRTVSDESIRALPSRAVEPKTDNMAGARVGSQLSSTPPHLSTVPTGSSYAGRLSEVHNMEFE
ncbi:eukaryotic translation initiation factor-related [Forsythia ovata]|uniref:Eukaryotic translation initiation factor-related n=1 Tax=Forsythia ovata TaxID=205694 RepID=A0ABD1R7G3_9LAMI